MIEVQSQPDRRSATEEPQIRPHPVKGGRRHLAGLVGPHLQEPGRLGRIGGQLVVPGLNGAQ